MSLAWLNVEKLLVMILWANVFREIKPKIKKDTLKEYLLCWREIGPIRKINGMLKRKIPRLGAKSVQGVQKGQMWGFLWFLFGNNLIIVAETKH